MLSENYIAYAVIAATIIFFTLGILIISIIWRIQKNNQNFFLEKNQLQSKFEQELLQTQLEIQEQTLKTISEEIHDNVGQVLSLAKLNLNTVGTISDVQVQSKIDSTKDLVSKAINDLRNLSRSLHGEKIGEIGLQEAVANELKILENSGQYVTVLNITGKPFKLDPQKEMVLFRIVQEALHNAVKHAHATKLKVELKYSHDVFNLIIHDNGVGFKPEALQSTQTGIGLKNMHNRAALIGGEFSINSSEKNGTSICIEIPNIQI